MLFLKLSFGNSGRWFGGIALAYHFDKYDIAFFLLNCYVRALDQVATVTLKYRRALSLHVFFTLVVKSRQLGRQLCCSHVPFSTFISIFLCYFHLCLKIHALGERKSLEYHVNYLKSFIGLARYI